jgi:cytochrome b561
MPYSGRFPGVPLLRYGHGGRSIAHRRRDGRDDRSRRGTVNDFQVVAVGYRNTHDAFGSVAKALHWLIAAFFLCSYASVYYAIVFTVDGMRANDIAVQLHITCGILVAGLILLRIVWRHGNVRPTLPPGPALEHLTARIIHASLYACMILMPVTGYLGTYRDAEWLGLPNFGRTAAFEWIAERFDTRWEAFEVPMDFLHRDVGGSKLVWILIALHVGAALYHHFVRRDGTLLRMLPSRRAMPPD